MAEEPEILYDVVAHFFFCEGHVDKSLFLRRLWDTWDTDWCSPDYDLKKIRYSYARWVPGKPGFYMETATRGEDVIPVTIVDGDVLNLGPERCIFCHALMHLKNRTYLYDVEESWDCPVCHSQVTVVRKRPK
jgi:hypothetical protein